MLLAASGQAQVAEKLPVASSPFGPPLEPGPSVAAVEGGGEPSLLFSTRQEGLTTLWRSEGTRESTELFLGPEDLPFTSPLAQALGLAFFHRRSGASVELWRSDGTPEGTIPLGLRFSSSTGRPAPPLIQLEAFALTWIPVNDQVEVWRTDGTAAGTFLLTTLDTLFVETVLAVGDRVLFSAFSPFSQPRFPAFALWITDGTETGTRLLQDPMVGFLDAAAAIGDNIVFLTGSPASEPVSSVRRTDGTPEGTEPVGSRQLRWKQPRPKLVSFEGAVFYQDLQGLWRTDGTDSGTTLVFPRAEQTIEAELGCGRDLKTTSEGIYFVLPANEGCELWTGPGAIGSEVLLKRFLPTTHRERFLATHESRVFLSLSDAKHGAELWTSDGSPEGTALVHDIFPGGASSLLFGGTIVGNSLFFLADDGFLANELWALPLSSSVPSCRSTDHALCLRERFRVEARWKDFRDREADGRTLRMTADTGSFWFFRPENLEVVLKVLDGREVNDHFWTFYGALSNVDYWLTVTDTATGLTRRYRNRSGTFASVGDTRSFGPLGASLLTSPDSLPSPGGALPEIARLTIEPDQLQGSCSASSERLCLNEGRFAVEVSWEDFRGNRGTGKAVDLTDDTGYFWFFKETNVELALKVLDGTANNGNYWVFYGSLSNVDFDVTVTDTETGAVRVYRNRGRQFASVGDTRAFPPL